MGYTYKFCYQCVPDDLKKQIIDMWLNDNVFDLQIAKQRVEEVAVVLFDPNNEVCCVTTVYIVKNKLNNDNVYMFRMYVRKKDRGKTKLKASKLTYEHLKTYNHPLKPVGVIAVAENEKITQRVMKSSGWGYIGKNKINQDIYGVLF